MQSEPQSNFLQTYLGQRFYPLEPRAEDVNMTDISHALSMQCRYAGHCIVFYSVAEHACHMYDYARRRFDDPIVSWWALHHDDSEAYVNDLIRPVKNELPEYKVIENGVMDVICERYGAPKEMPAIVKALDNRIIEDERKNMMPMDWGVDRLEPLGITLQCWSPKRADAEFMMRVNLAQQGLERAQKRAA